MTFLPDSRSSSVMSCCLRRWGASLRGGDCDRSGHPAESADADSQNSLHAVISRTRGNAQTPPESQSSSCLSLMRPSPRRKYVWPPLIAGRCQSPGTVETFLVVIFRSSFRGPGVQARRASKTTGYGYNADGQLSSITYPLPASATWATSPTVTYNYDNADLLSSVTDFNGNQIIIGSTADSLPNSATLGTSGDTISTTYDNTDIPSAISLKNGTSTLQSFTYADSPAGTILNETDTPNSSQSPAVYTYDAKARVTSMTPGTGSTLNYSFDASSNLTTLPTGGTGTYDNAGELTSATLSGTTTAYAYNADGQRLTSMRGSTTSSSAAWNGARQVTSYSDPAATMTAATYDGMRVTATHRIGHPELHMEYRRTYPAATHGFQQCIYLHHQPGTARAG